MISQSLITKPKRDGRLKSAISKIFSIALYIGLIYHFSLIAIYQFPDNPIKHKYKIEINSYVDPMFSQAWTLFSPNPINSNMSLLYQFQYKNNGKIVSTSWIDVTQPLITNRKENYWSPYQRISKFIQSSMQNINENNNLIAEHIKATDSLKNDKLKSNVFYQKAMNTAYGHKCILQYSQFVAKKYFKNDLNNFKNLFVRYKIFNAKFPRFSKRNEDYYDLKKYTFEEVQSIYYRIK